jgi:hypothetical protein
VNPACGIFPVDTRHREFRYNWLAEGAFISELFSALASPSSLFNTENIGKFSRFPGTL